VFAVPDAARTACWLNAWVTRRTSADDTIAGLTGPLDEVDFRGLGDDGTLSAALVLGEVRRLGVTRASLALPLPGHLIGLAGPSRFNQAVVDCGQGVVLHGSGTGLVPHRASRTLTWLASPADTPSFVPDIASADRDLREAFRTVTASLVELDVTSWNPDIADALMNLRAPMQLDADMAFPSPLAARTTMAALRALHIVDLALSDDGGAVTANEVELRRRALAPLSVAGRAAIVAACSSLDGR